MGTPARVGCCSGGVFVRRFLPVVFSLLLCACASIAPGGRSQVTAPTPISSVFSSIDMNMQLAGARPIDKPCSGLECRANEGFDHQVRRLGERLAKSAYASVPELKDRVPAFDFVVANKAEPGTASTASGTIVIYRGVRKSHLDEEALGFLIAREMGHVIARHHDEKSATTILISVIAQVVLPVANLAPALATLAGSAASKVGSDVVAANKSADQAREAENIAMDLLARQGWTAADVAGSLAKYTDELGSDGWANGLRECVVRYEEPAPAVPFSLAQAPRKADFSSAE